MKELKAVSYLRKIKEYYSVSFSDEAIQNIDEALAELKELMQVKGCKWTDENDGYFDGYKTACGQIQYFGEGEISDNKYKFCPYCGGKIDYTPKG